MEAVEQNSPPKQREKKNSYTSTVSRIAFTYRRLHISAHKHYSAQCSTTIPRFRIPPLSFSPSKTVAIIYFISGRLPLPCLFVYAVSSILFCGRSFISPPKILLVLSAQLKGKFSHIICD